jgi:hypothetical protein
VLLGIPLYLAALRLIAPDRIAEALRFAREQGESEPETSTPAPAE